MFTNSVFKKNIQIVFLVLVILQVLFCFFWAFENLGVMPLYGDSSDYIYRANPLLIHKIRPFTLPLIIRLSQELVGQTYFLHLLFIIQTSITFISIWLVAGVFLPTIKTYLKTIIVVVVGTNPLIMHFNYTVTPDSLAGSLTLLALYFLWRIYTTTKFNIYIYFQFIAFIVSFVLAANTRGERFFSMTLGVFLSIIFLYLVKKTLVQKKQVIYISFAVVIGMLCNWSARQILPATNEIVHLNYNFHKYHMIANSMSWPYLMSIYPKLPQYIKDNLPEKEVITYDNNLNYFYVIKEYLDPLGKHAYKDIILTILKYEWISVSYRYVLGGIYYSLTPFYPYFNFKGVVKEELKPWTPFTCFYGTQNWTYTRMEMHTPYLTLYYWYVSLCIFFVSLVILSIALYRKKVLIYKKGAYIFFTVSTLITAIIFTFNSSTFIHIRYAITWHIMFLLMLMTIIIPYLYNKDN